MKRGMLIFDIGGVSIWCRLLLGKRVLKFARCDTLKNRTLFLKKVVEIKTVVNRINNIILIVILRIPNFLHLTLGFRGVFCVVKNLKELAYKTEEPLSSVIHVSKRPMLVQCYLTKRRKTAGLNFYDNKFLYRRLFARRAKRSPDSFVKNFYALLPEKRICAYKFD